MHDLMNLCRWLRQPAATFSYPSSLAQARPGSVAYRGPESAAAESSAPHLGEIYMAGVVGRTDEEIGQWVVGEGGYPTVCYSIMRWLTSLPRTGDYEVTVDLGDYGLTWTMRSRAGTTSFGKAKRSTRSRLELSPTDFLRLVFRELDLAHACASGRAKLRGDADGVVRAIRSLASHGFQPRERPRVWATTPVTPGSERSAVGVL